MCMGGGSSAPASTTSVPVTSTPSPVIPQSPAATPTNNVKANNTGTAPVATSTGSGLNIPG